MEAEFIKWAALAILGGFTYMMKRELNQKDEAIKELRDDIRNIKMSYLHKDDFKDFKIELRSMFDDLKKDIRAIHEKN